MPHAMCVEIFAWPCPLFGHMYNNNRRHLQFFSYMKYYSVFPFPICKGTRLVCLAEVEHTVSSSVDAWQ